MKRTLKTHLGRHQSKSTKIGIFAIFVSSFLICGLYLLSCSYSGGIIPNTLTDMSAIISSGNHRKNDTVHVWENSVFKSAKLNDPNISTNVLKLVESVVVVEKRLLVRFSNIFYRVASPPNENFAKFDLLLLHGQAFTSENWLVKNTMQILAASGYRVLAVDLPGYGKTGGRTIATEEKPAFLHDLLEHLQVNRPVLFSPSMSGSYSVDFVMKNPQLVRAFVAIAPTNSGDFDSNQYSKNKLPTLLLYGERDTSLGIMSASNFKWLPNGRIFKMAAAGHACYLDNPDLFHTVVANFLDLVRSHDNRIHV